MKTTLRKIVWSAITTLRFIKQRQIPAWLRYLTIKRKCIFSRSRKDSVNRELLMLAWEFPPMLSGGVFRPLSFILHAAKFGWKCRVVSGPVPDLITEAGYELDNKLPENLIVKHVSADNAPTPWPLPNIDGGIFNAMVVFEEVTREIAAELPKNSGGKVILASGPPFHNFVAAAWLSRAHGWKLVLDYRDEWTQSPHGFNRCDNVNKQWESQCLNQADLVIFTTQSQLDHQLRVFPVLSREKCLVIHNGWEPADFIGRTNKATNQFERSNSKIVISFFGNLGRWWKVERFIETLVECCESNPELAQQIEVQFVGKKPPDIFKMLKGKENTLPLRLMDHIPKKDVCKMMQTSDVLLLLNPPSLDRYIPGKLYEYIAAERPILLYGEGGEMGNIISELEVGDIVPQNDGAALAQSIKRLTSMKISASKKKSVWLESRTRYSLATKLFKALDVLDNS